MDLVKTLLEQHGGELVRAVMGAGLSQGEAERFVPEATRETTSALRSGQVDPKALLGGDLSGLLQNLDLAGLAASAGIDPSKASSGLAALVPMVMRLLQGQSGDLGDLAGLLGGLGKAGDGAGLGGLLGGAKKLFD